jgi:hypothetical protein
MRLFLIAGLALFASCGQSPETTDNDNNSDTSMTSGSTTESVNTLTEAEKAEGWRLLFDGKSTSGWHSYLNKSNLGAWKIEDGLLALDTTTKEGRGDIVTDEEFENYHLKVDWKISPNGNSGIIFNVKEAAEYESDYFTGPEMQVLDNDGHADGKIHKHRAGDLYDLIPATPETVKAVGEWNTAEIIKNGDSLEFRLNGPTVVKTTLWNDEWKKMVANSKFKQWKAFGTFKSGKIALQDHDNAVWFRNIKIRKL